MNILVTLNRGYLKQLKIMLLSIVDNNPHTEFNVFVVHNSLNKFDFYELVEISENICFHSIYVDDNFLKKAPTTSRYPKEMYYRIFACRLIPNEVKKILYLDPDIVVINSLDELYNMDLEGNLFAAASHLKETGVITKINELRLSMHAGTGYYNSGVMLMDLEQLRRELSEKEIFEYIEEHKSGLILPDQDILNGIYSHRIKSIDPYRYNISDRILTLHNLKSISLSNKIFLDWVEENAVIIHYCGRNKPWKDNYIGELNFFYNEYENMLMNRFNEIKKDSR